eukprot:TRINITY_DN1993_c0_g1_i2.p1 TRINITY_DN1993_c0_g1~~TRINITY_DN1993_c0_g1_i2.p1  ORF type:complete len:641 (-),score=88.23 TRINITY_DN1993_c0_g1_i2:660-2582(-)
MDTREMYWNLVEKADRKFARVRDLPAYGRNRYDSYFQKVFKVYTKLWKFQQENRQKLVEEGLKRWEIGEIASRIGQLYYSQYQRTSEASYLSESYIFYDAILSREYFKDSANQDLSLANKQLRCYARFVMVCLMLNRKEMAQNLLHQFRLLVDDYRRVFQDADSKEWKRLAQEAIRFIKADNMSQDKRPLRYSVRIDPNPSSLPRVLRLDGNKALKLRDAILTSYHHNEVKFAEITLDSFRMIQCLEWEPSGMFYQMRSSESGMNGALQSGSNRTNPVDDITDPTLPPNPRKAVLYRPTVTHLLTVLATICEELAGDSVVLLYVSASGKTNRQSAAARTSLNSLEGSIHNDHSAIDVTSDENSMSPMSSPHDSPTTQSPNGNTGLLINSRGKAVNVLYPGDILPFTRIPLFLIIDSDNSNAFKVISGAERGEPAALLLSPVAQPLFSNLSSGDCSRYQNSGSLFTFFLTAPLPAFCRIVGMSLSTVSLGICEQAENVLSTFLTDWGLALAASSSVDLVWARLIGDPFIRRIILRFIFCRSCLTLLSVCHNKKECIPECLPRLPDEFLPSSSAVQSCIFQLANIFKVASHFRFSPGIFSGIVSEKENQSRVSSSNTPDLKKTPEAQLKHSHCYHADEENGL